VIGSAQLELDRQRSRPAAAFPVDRLRCETAAVERELAIVSRPPNLGLDANASDRVDCWLGSLDA
jgi:hypothetical protein